VRLLSENKIVLASHNKGKLAEISDLLAPFGIEVISAGELGLEEPEETESTFAGNARIKAHFAAKESGLPALSDDSGLMVDALDGAPGVYSADWAETPNGRDFDMAMNKVWQKLDEVSAASPRLAEFRCTFCLAWPDGGDEICEGVVKGQLTWPARGEKGFGFDPMFVPLGDTRTFAEMGSTEKKAISHRTDAFKKLLNGPLKERA